MTEALDNKQLKDLPNEKDISGQLTRIDTTQKEFEGVMKTSLVLWLRDQKENENYRVSVGINKLGRSIINSLASIEGKIGVLSFSVYNNKTTGKPTIKIRHDGADVSWKYSLEEMDKYVKKTTKRVPGPNGKPIEKDEYDLIDLEEMLLNVWNTDIKAKVSSTPQTPFVSDGPKDDAPDDSNGSDDLPF